MTATIEVKAEVEVSTEESEISVEPRLIVDSRELAKALRICGQIIGKKPMHVNLTFAKLTLDEIDQTVKIQASNVKNWITINLPAKVIRGGEICLPIWAVQSLVESLDSDIDLGTFLTDGGDRRLEIVSSQVRSTFPTLFKSEFVEWLEPENEFSLETAIENEPFFEAMNLVSFAASTDPKREAICCVHVDFNDTGMTSYATNGHFMARSGKTPTGNSVGLNLPTELIGHIKSCVGGKDFKLSAASDRLKVESDGVEFESTLLGYSFPEVEYLFPQTFKTQATFSRHDVLMALHRLGISLNSNEVDYGNKDRVPLKFYRDRLVIGSEDVCFREVIPVKAKIGKNEAREINFGFGYLLAILSKCPTDAVTLSFNGLREPTVISADADHKVLLMPLLVQE